MSLAASATVAQPCGRALLLDCLRVRDLGGDWLDHEWFSVGSDHGAVTSALVKDGVAAWDEFGIHITPRGRRTWAESRIALRNLTEAVECAL